MVNTLFLPELREMLAENNEFELHEFCTALHPARTAEFMEGLEAADAWSVLRHADLKLREEIFGYFPHAKQVETIESQDRAEVAELLADLPADDRVDLLHDVRPEVVEELSQAVVSALGSSFRPAQVLFVADLPKTRTMKIMRRLVRSMLLGQSTGDLSGLVNPESLAGLAALALKPGN